MIHAACQSKKEQHTMLQQNTMIIQEGYSGEIWKYAEVLMGLILKLYFWEGLNVLVDFKFFWRFRHSRFDSSKVYFETYIVTWKLYKSYLFAFPTWDASVLKNKQYISLGGQICYGHSVDNEQFLSHSDAPGGNFILLLGKPCCC